MRNHPKSARSTNLTSRPAEGRPYSAICAPGTGKDRPLLLAGRFSWVQGIALLGRCAHLSPLIHSSWVTTTVSPDPPCIRRPDKTVSASCWHMPVARSICDSDKIDQNRSTATTTVHQSLRHIHGQQQKRCCVQNFSSHTFTRLDVPRLCGTPVRRGASRWGVIRRQLHIKGRLRVDLQELTASPFSLFSRSPSFFFLLARLTQPAGSSSTY
ncbi:hypothetical protein V8E36_008331 [Tilletia maclaganii]